MIYREEDRACESFKQNYFDGIVKLIDKRQKEAEKVRDEYIKNIFTDAERYREEFKAITKSDEDVLSCALFPQVAPKFLEERDRPKTPEATTDENTVRELFVEDLSI